MRVTCPLRFTSLYTLFHHANCVHNGRAVFDVVTLGTCSSTPIAIKLDPDQKLLSDVTADIEHLLFNPALIPVDDRNLSWQQIFNKRTLDVSQSTSLSAHKSPSMTSRVISDEEAKQLLFECFCDD